MARTIWLLVATLSTPAHATGGPELSWMAPDECPGPDVLRAGVEQSLARPWDELESELSIEARFESVGEQWRLELLVRRGGEALPPRRVEGESCPALVEAGAAIVALIIERELVPAEVGEPVTETEPPESAEPEPPPEPPPESEPTSSDADPAAPVAPSRARRRLQGSAEVAGLVDTWSLPRASFGGRLGGGIGGRMWSVALDGVGLLPVKWDLGLGEEGKYGRYWLVGAQLRGCHVLGRGAVQLTSCAAVEGDWLQASTHGVSHEDAGGVPVWSLGPEVGLLVGRPAHRLRLGFGTQFPFAHPGLVVEDEISGQTLGETFRPPRATVRVLVGYRLDP